MKRFLILTALVLGMAGSQLFAQRFYKSLEPDEKQMVVYVGAYDWGPCIEKVVINTGRLIDPKEFEKQKDDFELNRLYYSKEANLGMKKAPLKITDVFFSDSKGNKTTENGKYITITTEVSPTAENSSPFVGFIAGGVFEKFYNYKVENDDLDIEISNCRGFVNEEATRFTTNFFNYDLKDQKEGQTLELAYHTYLPEIKNKNKKIPMILWFHTIGESGSNPYQVLFGIKATALAGDKIQSYFEDGVAILAPQCPTGWLETVDENAMGIRYWAPVDIDGTVQKVANPLVKFLNKFVNAKTSVSDPETKPFAAVSYYTEPITALLMDFLDSHPEIDRNRVYVGGASAGGYMTMNMMIEHPEIFAAAFPTCEYYLNSKITNSQIKMLAKKPMWFTYAKNDMTVKPADNCIPTIKRLREAGAKNLKVSVFENVVDPAIPYEYEGHASWIYVLNDQCRDESGQSLFAWLSRQRLHVEK